MFGNKFPRSPVHLKPLSIRTYYLFATSQILKLVPYRSRLQRRFRMQSCGAALHIHARMKQDAYEKSLTTLKVIAYG